MGDTLTLLTRLDILTSRLVFIYSIAVSLKENDFFVTDQTPRPNLYCSFAYCFVCNMVISFAVDKELNVMPFKIAIFLSHGF
jgi:hypothetical protein